MRLVIFYIFTELIRAPMIDLKIMGVFYSGEPVIE